jgi:ribulose-5-phosphate 4-epimerase/fuculose-1-phosphate aldolase
MDAKGITMKDQAAEDLVTRSTSAGADAASLKDKVSDQEWQARVDLAATYRLVALHGWDDMIFTHISMRVPGPEHHFLINPYGFLFEEITASSLVKIDKDGNAVEDTPYFVNPAGFTIHSAIHEAREDAHCVLHLHTDQGVAVSSQKHGLLPLAQHALGVINDLAYHDYEGIALDLDERERLVHDLGEKSFMLLRNHGTLTVGESCAAAFMRMFWLERACRIQILAQAGGDLILEDQAMADRVGEQAAPAFHKDLGAALAWPGLLRKLDRQMPGYDA